MLDLFSEASENSTWKTPNTHHTTDHTTDTTCTPTQHNIGKERETRLFLDSTGGGAGPFERDISLLKISRSELYLIATFLDMYMYMYMYVHM